MFFICTLIYVLVSLSVGFTMVGLSLRILTLETLFSYLNGIIYNDQMAGLITGWGGVLIIISCLVFIRRQFNRIGREEVVTIQSSEGVVKISVSAIEDMVKKMLENREEIIQIKPKVRITRKGINILVRGSLNAEVNLAEVTAAIQNEVKRKVRNILGGAMDIKVNMDIKKFSFSPRREILDNDETEVPFRNY